MGLHRFARGNCVRAPPTPCAPETASGQPMCAPETKSLCPAVCTRNYIRAYPCVPPETTTGRPSVLTGTTSGHPAVCTGNHVGAPLSGHVSHVSAPEPCWCTTLRAPESTSGHLPHNPPLTRSTSVGPPLCSRELRPGTPLCAPETMSGHTPTHTHAPWARGPQVCTCQASPSGLLLGQGKPRFQVLSPCSPHKVLVSALLAAPTPERRPYPPEDWVCRRPCWAPRCVVSVRLFALCFTLVLRGLDGLDQVFGACDPWPGL